MFTYLLDISSTLSKTRRGEGCVAWFAFTLKKALEFELKQSVLLYERVPTSLLASIVSAQLVGQSSELPVNFRIKIYSKRHLTYILGTQTSIPLFITWYPIKPWGLRCLVCVEV